MWALHALVALLYSIPWTSGIPQYLTVTQHLTRNPTVHGYPFSQPGHTLPTIHDTIHADQPLQNVAQIPQLPQMPPVQTSEPQYPVSQTAVQGEPAFMPSREGALQVVHAAAPNERDWVITAGNESLVDNVLAISLNYGGRLVSMGYFVRSGAINYYAIMHKYSGPVFIKPSPMTFDELVKSVRENEQRDLALTQVCGQEDKEGVTFSTYWERIPGVQFHIWFPGTPHADAQRTHFEKEGFRLTHLCGYSVGGKGKYIGVWQKPTLQKLQYEAHYGLSLENMMRKDKELGSRNYIATSFRCFNNRRQILCSGIWEYRPGSTSTVTVGDNLARMYQQFARNPRILPRQISHIQDSYGGIKLVVLWSDVNSNRYPNPPSLWNATSVIPVRYLKGSPDLVTPTQLDFIVKRVEHFMKDLNIPGLSIAISKKEQLKFAAGFGYADVKSKEVVTPNHQFRVGSVSKPITASAVMMLVDQRKIDLDRNVWGRGGYFGMEFSGKRPYRKYVADVTVRHLLEHSSGGWDNLASDAAWIQPHMTTAELISYVLENVPLTEKPGTVWIYSNFGYQVLGYLIERTSGQTYENFVKKHIFAPADVHDIQIARPTISDRAPREVLYYMSGNGIGFNPYEMLPPERIGPWGGWIASPIQLLMFMSAVDGFPRRPDILTQDSIHEWAIPSVSSNDTYGLGWSLNIMGFNGWQHDGRMPGSASMLVRLSNGLEMAVTVNKEYSERDFFHELGYVLHHIGNNCDWWNEQKYDLFQRRQIKK